MHRFPFSFLSPGVDDIVTFLVSLHQSRYHFGRVLKVGIHHDHGVATRMIEARGDGRLVAEVPRKPHDLYPGVLCVKPAHDIEGPVLAVIVDEHDLVVRRDALHDLRQAFVKDMQGTLFIINGQYDGVIDLFHVSLGAYFIIFIA